MEMKNLNEFNGIDHGGHANSISQVPIRVLDEPKHCKRYVYRSVRVDPKFSPEDQDLQRFCWYTDGCGYAQRTGNAESCGKTIRAHRVIGKRIAGRNLLSSEQVDHINGDKLDNRRVNLRICSRSQNSRNRHVTFGASRYIGVSWHKDRRKWRAGITLDGKTYSLGYYHNEDDAARAYNFAAAEMGFLTRNIIGRDMRLNINAPKNN